MAEAMRVEAASWKGRGGSAMLTNPRLSGFFLQLAQRLARQGSLRVCFLRLNGAPIAMQIGVVHAGRWWVLKIGYDERWAEHSPGIQLMWDVLRAAFEAAAELVRDAGQRRTVAEHLDSPGAGVSNTGFLSVQRPRDGCLGR